ncbi:MAG: hypothetical protein EZS28_023828 [Streblomastix strix]|uniref:Uncharacterized protein n=1 Tax=Streblomastix strix TaxID=222440 RepID=A0A5J4VDT9_9EUKA|nr:MAG: hypothetical protein EZS28_023828 [Streblomastix strix]
MTILSRIVEDWIQIIVNKLSGEIVTELEIHQSVNEFEAIIAYSLAYIEVSHNFYESFQIAIQLNGPQAVEKPNQNLMCSSVLYCYVVKAVAPDSIVIVQGISIYQLIQQVQTHEQVAVPLAASGALFESALLPRIMKQLGFWTCFKNFGSKILGGITKAANRVAPTLNKVLGTVAAPISMIHPAIGSAMGIGAKLTGGVDRHINGPRQ